MYSFGQALRIPGCWGSQYFLTVGTCSQPPLFLENIPGTHFCCRSQWPYGLSVGLRPLACWDRGFESHRRHGCLSAVSVVCCQVEVSATDWSLVQRSPTDCGASLCMIKNPRKTRRLKAHYRAVENTTTIGCNAKKTNSFLLEAESTSGT
jgi:hypothetical protein